MSVRVVAWQGVCDECGESAPETRDSEEEARQDADECPCLDGMANGMDKSTVVSIIASMDSASQPRFIETRYPYTYACDILRGNPEIVPTAVCDLNRWPCYLEILSRGEASEMIALWADHERRPELELAEILADAYLRLNGIVKS